MKLFCGGYAGCGGIDSVSDPALFRASTRDARHYYSEREPEAKRVGQDLMIS